MASVDSMCVSSRASHDEESESLPEMCLDRFPRLAAAFMCIHQTLAAERCLVNGAAHLLQVNC